MNTQITANVFLKCQVSDLFPKDALQIEILAQLAHSRGYKTFAPTMNLLSRYFFAYPIITRNAVSSAWINLDVLC